MATIDPLLLERLKSNLGVGRSRLYQRIDQKARDTLLPRPQAALALALDLGIGINRFASAEDLAALRQHRNVAVGPPTVMAPVAAPASARAPTRSARSKPRPRGPKNKVFVIHGRNATLLAGLHNFLRALKLDPIEWSHALRLPRKGTPSLPEIIDAAFQEAAALVVLISPDDVAQLKREFWKRDDPSYEKRLTGQARANVLFEAGMAFAHKPDATILVEVGKVRPFSDVAGRHILRLNNSKEKRKEFVIKLQAAGCDADDSGVEWMNAGDFTA